MKNTLFVLSLLLLLAFSAETKAQSAEETVDWLKSKFALPNLVTSESSDITSERLSLPQNFMSELKKCRFTVEHSYTMDGNRKYLVSYSMSLQNEVKMFKSEDNIYRLHLNDEGITYKEYSVSDNGEKTFRGDGSYNRFGFSFNEIEPRLPIRIWNAVEHLRNFCPNKSTEAF